MKYSDVIGFGIESEIDPVNRPGIFKSTIVERRYKGDLMRVSRQFRQSGNLNDNIVFSNEISIIADPFAFENFSNIKYAMYMGSKWKISNVRVEYPRLVLTMGDMWNENNTKQN